MPWRERRSVYAAVVSEFMLQQTQVATVIPYFERWVSRWPDFEALARADETQVLHAWEGLGYYSRARNLHRLACEIVKRPSFPQCAADWQTFKGVGKYTAAAIASIVQGERVPVIDGNVIRILARVTADKTVFKNTGTAIAHFAGTAEKFLSAKNPGVHNEAMMELGATVCTKLNPKCASCPVAKFCKGRHLKELERLPRFVAKEIKKIELQRAFAKTENGEILLERTAGTSKRLRELYEMPRWQTLFKGVPPPEKFLFKGKRAIAQESICEFIFAVPAPSKWPETIVPVPVADLDKITFSGPHRRWIERILQRGGSTRPL